MGLRGQRYPGPEGPVKRAPTPAEEKAIEAISRAMAPGEWAEFDQGNGVCTNAAGWEIKVTIGYAKKLIRAFPSIVGVVNA